MPSRPGVQTSVLVNGVADPTLRPLSARRSLGNKSLDTATFAVDLAAAGTRVQNLSLGQGGESVEIVGWVNGVLTSLAWGRATVGSIEVGKSEGITYTTRIEPYHLGVLMTGAYYNIPGLGPVVIQTDPIFNPLIDGVVYPNMTAAPYLPGNTPCFVDPESVRTSQAQTLQGGAPAPWYLPQAVQYLCWALNPLQADVLNPSPLNLAALPAVPLYNLGLSRGKLLGDYLDQLLDPWGWTWFVQLLAPGLRQLVLVQRGLGAAKTVLLQSPGSFWAGDNAEETAVDYNVGSTRNNVTVCGDWHYFESTFVLQRAWPTSKDGTSSVQLTQDADYNGDATNKRVWRDWVLNEAGDYNGTRPEIAAAYNFNAILGHALVPRRQKFLPTLTLDKDLAPVGQQQGVSIDFSTDGGVTWLPVKRLTDPTVQILERECGIRFDGNQVPWELYQAGSKAQVRVTATLRDDLRLGTNLPNDFTSPLAVSNPLLVDASDRFHWREVLAGSKYFANVSSGAVSANLADDTLALAAFAATLKGAWDMADVSGPIELEGLDSAQYDLGDLITALNGRAVSFAASAAGRFPQVQSIDYDFQAQKRTLHLETFTPPESALTGSGAVGGGAPLGQGYGAGGPSRPRAGASQSSGIAVRRMQLTSALTAGGNAQAQFVFWDIPSTSYKPQGTAITIYSYKNAAGSTGDQLDVAYRPDSQRWEVIEAKVGVGNGFITFTTAAALLASDASQASCPVVLVWEGNNPGSTVTVYNELGWEADAGVDGYAELCSADGKWKIIIVPCPAGAS